MSWDRASASVKRSNSVQPKREQGLLHQERSYLEDPENIPSSDSDSDFSVSDAGQRE